MSQHRTFFAPGIALEAMADDLARWFEHKGFWAQARQVQDGGAIVEARQGEGWRAALGMALATDVVLLRSGQRITVDCGQGQWVNKVVVGAVGLLLFFPVMVPAAIGAWRQSRLPAEVFSWAQSYISRASHAAIAEGPVTAQEPFALDDVNCPRCGQSVHVRSNYCDHCGQRLVPSE